ncbi:MAG: hypothetical protein DMF44_12755 [Verrucomicrobia bacterium]|nr:MAG: hypothetical protein DMF44_12755 [Verrucomicrobiota bacterium]
MACVPRTTWGKSPKRLNDTAKQRLKQSYKVTRKIAILSVLADAFRGFLIFELKGSSFAFHNRTDLLSGQNSDRGVKSVDASPRVDYKRRL